MDSTLRNLVEMLQDIKHEAQERSGRDDVSQVEVTVIGITDFAVIIEALCELLRREEAREPHS